MSAQPTPFADFQNEIYLQGLAGEPPTLPFGWRELEAAAHAALTPAPRGYVAGGAGAEDTMRANRAAFRRWRIVPRMLRDVGERDLRATVLGTAMPAPVLLAPVGVQSIVHPEGELAVGARGGRRPGVPYVASAPRRRTRWRRSPRRTGDAPRWFQLYWPRGPGAGRDLRRAAPRRRATRRSSSRSTPGCWAGARATCSGAYLPFLKGDRHRQLLRRPGVPRGAARSRRRRTAGRGRAVRRPVHQPDA